MKTLIIFLFTCTIVYAQVKDEVHNTFYGELFGNGSLYSNGAFSLNYERNIIYNFNLRVGIGFISSTSSSNSGEHSELGMDLIAMLNYLINIYGSSKVELGAGIQTGGPRLLPTLSFGYRFSPKEGGFFFKLTFDEIPNTDGFLFPSGGIGIGIRF